MTTDYKRHPLSAAWPGMTQAEFEKLEESMAKVGQLDPIVLLDGEVLDGYHRLMICKNLRIEPIFTEYEGSDPVGFVIGKHARRNLDQSQIAFAIAKMQKWKPTSGRPSGNTAQWAELNDHEIPPSGRDYQKTVSQVSQETGVSQRQIERAKRVADSTPPEVHDAITRGEVSIRAAEKVAKLEDDKKERVAQILRGGGNFQQVKDEVLDVPDIEESYTEADYLADLEKGAQEHLAQASAWLAEIDLDGDSAEASLIREIAKLKSQIDAYEKRINSLIGQVSEYKRLCTTKERQLRRAGL